MQGNGTKLVKLNNEHLEIWISPRHGGAVARFFEPGSGFQVLRETPLDAIDNGDTMKFGCFPMVPYSNRMGFRRMAFGDHVFQLEPNRAGAPHSFHGNAWMGEWTVEDLDQDRLGIAYDNAEGSGHWPFPYWVEQSFTLSESTCHMRLLVRNTGANAFPVGAGWHPFFHIEKDSRISFHAQRVWLNDDDMLPRESIPAEEEWNFSEGRSTHGLAVDNCFQGWSRTVVLEHPAQRRTVRITGCDRLSSLVVFRPTDGRQFIAIEPVSHVNNGVNLLAQGRRDTGVHILSPDETLEVFADIQVVPSPALQI